MKEGGKAELRYIELDIGRPVLCRAAPCCAVWCWMRMSVNTYLPVHVHVDSHRDLQVLTRSRAGGGELTAQSFWFGTRVDEGEGFCSCNIFYARQDINIVFTI